MRGLKVDQLTCGTIQVAFPPWDPPKSAPNIMSWCQDNSCHCSAKDKRHLYHFTWSDTKDRKSFGRESNRGRLVQSEPPGSLRLRNIQKRGQLRVGWVSSSASSSLPCLLSFLETFCPGKGVDRPTMIVIRQPEHVQLIWCFLNAWIFWICKDWHWHARSFW